MTSKPVRLRGHHFICLLYFRGDGHDREFVRAHVGTATRLSSEAAELVEGVDDICTHCPNLSAQRLCEAPKMGEAEAARIDALACNILGIVAGDRITLAESASRLRNDPSGVERWRESACVGCTWEADCQSGWVALLEA